MAKKDYYTIEKNIGKIIRGENTNFLDANLLNKTISKLKGYKYQVYYPFFESDKAIIYINRPPKIKLIEIISYEKLTHREIMGSLYNLNINAEMFGDIIIYNSHYYIIIIDTIYDLLLKDFKMVGNKHVKLKEVSINILDNYKRKYETIELIVSSTRLDTVVSRLIGSSRDSVKKIFVDGKVILNYEVCHKTNTTLKEDDIFSIRRNGKYKFKGIIKNTKKENYIIKLYKYIDN